MALLDNLVRIPVLDNSRALCEFFVESTNLEGLQMAWKFMLPAANCTERWLPFLDRALCTQTFICQGQILNPTSLRIPGPEVHLRRIVILSNGRQTINGGPWIGDNILLTQYQWKGGTPLNHSSTSLLRQIQNSQQAQEHPAIRKWESQLSVRLPEHIWHNTWLPFRAAKENTFLWLIIYRAIATLSWVFPGLPSTDSSTWCPRCPLRMKEDILHCLWLCPSSRIYWLWTEGIISRAAGLTLRVQLTAAQVLLAAPFSDAIEVPFRLWQILRASLCWQLWIARNDCVFSHIPDDPDTIIRRTWHRLSSHLRVEWKAQLAKIRKGQINREEARARMAFIHGIEGVVWDLENFKLRIPPCPPRPP